MSFTALPQRLGGVGTPAPPPPPPVAVFRGFDLTWPANPPCQVFAESEHFGLYAVGPKTGHQQKTLKCSTGGGIKCGSLWILFVEIWIYDFFAP